MNCPTNDELLAYTTGQLEERTSEALAGHIRDCETCQTRLSTIDDSQDSLLARLRRSPEVDAYEQEPQCEQAARLAAALMPAAARDARGLADLAGGDPECQPTYLGDEPRGEPAATAGSTATLVRELGEYELLEKLGEGGMGAVYKARHRRLDKIVAVKVLPQDRMADPLALARFDREMKAVGRVTHPNIVQAFDAREIDGTHFLAMEYVAGMDLGDVVLNGGAMRIADACEVVRQIASGLQCAHENGLVHRDIKPSNAILTPGGQVKILDLGLARLSGGPANVEASRGEMTSSGTAMGTADYMAPEQATDSHTADIRADIYSLGCTLYKLLSGKPPFSGPKYKNNMEKIMGHMRDAPPPIGLLRTDVPTDLVAVIDRMMSKERDARFATPQEVVEALLPFAAGANLIRLHLEADAMRRGESLVEQSVLGTEPGAPSAVSDTTRNLECGDLSPLSFKAHAKAKPPGSSDHPPTPHVSPSPPPRVSPSPRLLLCRPTVLIALGLVGLVVLAGVIVITIRDRNNKIVSQTTVPDDNKIEVAHQAGVPSEKPGSAPALPTGQWIMLVKSEEDLKAWKKTGAGTVTFDNGALRVQNAAVTYPTLAIDLVIRVQIQVEVSVKPTAKLLLRQTPAGSYSAVLEGGTKLVVGVTEGEKWRELKSAPVIIPTGQPLALEFSAVGKVLTVSLNGQPAVEVQDGTHSYGSPGLAATDGTTVFKDVQVNVATAKEPELAQAAKLSPATVPSSFASDASLPPWKLPPGAPPPAMAPFDAAQARKHQEAWAKYLGVPVEFTNSIGMKLVLIPPGEFDMGSTQEQIQQSRTEAQGQQVYPWYFKELSAETPRHRVRISNAFYFGEHEVSVGLFRKFVEAAGYETEPKEPNQGGWGIDTETGEWDQRAERSWRRPGFVQQDQHPVVQVNWNDATAYCGWLGSEEDRIYRLPTEAEWEYACRAGTITCYFSGDEPDSLDGFANVADVALSTAVPSIPSWGLVKWDDRWPFTAPVGCFQPNGFGLYDAHGNVGEWCADYYDSSPHANSPSVDPQGPSTGSNRAQRGAGWSGYIGFCRAAKRYGMPPTYSSSTLGFRVATSLAFVGGVSTSPQKSADASPQTKASPTPKPSEPPAGKPAAPATTTGKPTGPTPPPAVAPFDEQKAKEHQAAWAKYLGVPVEMENSIGMTFMLIPPGEFDMGTTEAEVAKLLEEAKGNVLADLFVEHMHSEAPKHRIGITKPFYLGLTEVTQAEYERVVGSNPSKFKDGPTCPVEMVNWDEASAFCRKLGELTSEQAGYRLPTEAEWEYACRAGTTTEWYSGDDEAALREHAWFSTNAGETAHPVRQKRPNAWGLYDMHGNVWEWGQDWRRNYGAAPVDDPTGPPSGVDRVIRGGCWKEHAFFCRSVYRGWWATGDRYFGLGFRLARTVSSVKTATAGQTKSVDESGQSKDGPTPKPSVPTTPQPAAKPPSRASQPTALAPPSP